jgi:glycosyltransferase involved in cell wall biosynthesis
MVKNNKFSLIIPTYSGEQFIGEVFESILSQITEYEAEVIVVIDGPRKSLEVVVLSYKSLFIEKNIPFKIIMFKKNKGRFDARLAGAKKAKNSRLLFADDRNIFGKNYLNSIIDTSKDITIPNVIQEESLTVISKTLYMLRKSIYKNWGGDFKSYYITNANFESSSKGTTGLWVSRELFISACEKIINSTNNNNKYLNEDTKLFREFLNEGHRIYRCSEAKVYYKSRTSFKSEVRHLYERGPRFVNYYSKPGTRFFIPLVIISILPLLVLSSIFLNPILILYILFLLLISMLALSLIISRKAKNIPTAYLGLIIIFSVFSTGVYSGIYKNVRDLK